MGKVSLVVFDFDGTLAETREAVSTTVNGALAAHGLPRVAPLSVWAFMGLPLETLFTKSIPPTMRHRVDVASLVAWYRDRFEAVGAPLVTPMPGADAVLDALAAQGCTLAIATSREASSLDPLLDRFGWTGRFAAVGTCDRVSRGKPDPELLALVLAEADGEAALSCMVGDTTWDVEMAQALGVRSVAVPDGSHDAERLAASHPDVVLPSLLALPDWLRSADGASR